MSREDKGLVEAKSTYRKIADQLLVAMKSKEFKELARKTHQDIRYSELADRLEECNKKLNDKQVNIVEWYLLCQQVNANLVTYGLGSIASNLGESATTIPVIKQISDLVDQLVICSLDLGKYINLLCMKKLKGKKGKEVVTVDSVSPESVPTSKRHELFEKYIQPSLTEINASIAAIREKHNKGNEDPNTLRLSTVGALLRIAAELINLQSKIITGLLVEPSREAGNIINQMVDQSEVSDVVKSLSGWIMDMIKLVMEMPVNLEIIALKRINELGDILTKVEGLDPGADLDHRESSGFSKGP